MNTKFPICYETHGEPENPCIILITGIGGQLIQWSELFIEGLVKQNLFVVTFDNRDSGLSKYYDNFSMADFVAIIQAKQAGKEINPPYTFNDMADDIVMLMEKLSIEKAHIAGSSMGGMIAQTFALKHPNHMLSLILIATSSGDVHLPPPKPEVLQYMQTSFSNTSETLTSYVEGRAGLFKLYDPYFFNEEKSRRLSEKMYDRSSGKGSEGFKRQLLAFISEQPRGEKLKKVTVKSFIVQGGIDAAFSVEHGKYLHEVLQNSRLEIMEKMGHLIPDELSDEIVMKIGQFIKDNTIKDSVENNFSQPKL